LDYLDEKLEKIECDHSNKLTTDYLKSKNVDMYKILDWLRENGGYCDCEILYNIEDVIEGL